MRIRLPAPRFGFDPDRPCEARCSRAGSSALRVREETARLAAAIPPRATAVVLDREGTGWASEELARQLDRWREAAGTPCFIVGGAWGLEPAFVAGARFRWSLGPLTLPHELARVVLLEQWYRAWTIVRGEPYHRGGDR